MDRIPILRMGEYLLVTIQVDRHDRFALTLQDDLTDHILKHRVRGVLIDISLLDAQTVVVGMQPAVAITLVELGMSLPNIRTALNVERGDLRPNAADNTIRAHQTGSGNGLQQMLSHQRVNGRNSRDVDNREGGPGSDDLLQQGLHHDLSSRAVEGAD